MTEIPFTVNPDWVPGPWVQAKVQQAAFDVLAGRGDINWVEGPKGRLLSIPLGGYNTADGSEQDLTCDKCDKVVPAGLWSFAVASEMFPGVTVAFTGGLCETCAVEENAKPRKEK